MLASLMKKGMPGYFPGILVLFRLSKEIQEGAEAMGRADQGKEGSREEVLVDPGWLTAADSLCSRLCISSRKFWVQNWVNPDLNQPV